MQTLNTLLHPSPYKDGRSIRRSSPRHRRIRGSIRRKRSRAGTAGAKRRVAVGATVRSRTATVSEARTASPKGRSAARLCGLDAAQALSGDGATSSGTAGWGQRAVARTIPVLFGLGEAFAQGDAFPAFGFEVLEHVRNQGRYGLLVDVVGEDDAVARLRTAGSVFHPAVEDVLGYLDVILVGPVLGIEVVVCYDVAEILHDGLAGVVAFGVWRTHVGWVFSEDVTDCHFGLDHLVVALVVCDVIHVRMAPGVTADLMPLSVHSADDINPPGVCIESTVAIVSANEERSLEAILC
jgi:hypothetical protein